MVMDMVGGFRRWRYVDGTHAHGVGGGQVAAVILEHRAKARVQFVGGKNGFKSRALGFGAKPCMFHAVNRIKQVGQSACRQNPFGIGCRAVGIDDPATGQGADIGGKGLILLQMIKVYVMHICQIMRRVHPVFLHQSSQSGAVLRPIMAAQAVCFGFVHLQGCHHPIGHPHLYLIEQTGRGRVKRVIKVKDPSADMCEILYGHVAKLRRIAGIGNAFAVDCGLTPVRVWRDMLLKGLRVQKDAYTLILEAIDAGVYKPGDRLVESELADRFGVSRTPVREALQRLETQSMLSRDGRSLIVASLDHNQLAELYAVRTELEGLAARLAARHATDEEMRFLRMMVDEDQALLGGDPRVLSRANKRFHKQIHLASHNRFLVQQLDLVHRSMALMATTSFAAEGRDAMGLAEHDAIVRAIEARDGEAAYQALRGHISKAFETRLRIDAGEVKTR